MSAISPARKGSLHRRLVLPLSAFVLVTSVLLIGWSSWLYRQDSVRRFEGVASTNAGFMGEMPFPKSEEMAKRLSSIQGVAVGFYLPSEEKLLLSSESGWPSALEQHLRGLAGGGASTIRVDGFDVAMAPLADGVHYLVLARPASGALAGVEGRILVPAIVLTMTFGGLVFLLVRRIVRPLVLLTGWLPNLKPDEEEVEEIPETVSRRKDEIGQLARSLEGAHQRLLEEQGRRQKSERLATLGRIATSLAHEIRNPASAIRMHADLLARSEGGNRMESIELIGEEVDRISDLVNQWLFVARAAPPQKRLHDLVEILTAVTRRLLPILEHAGVSVREEVQGPVEVRCDRLRMEQVVRNLVVNAMQAMPQGGEILVGIEERDGEAMLEVRDSGAGFSEEALERFGEPFFSEREGGMGIGATLAREVIEAHGGSISVSNSSSGGGLVRASLPSASPRKISS